MSASPVHKPAPPKAGVICLGGPPACGKGTQAAKLLAHFGAVYLSTGEMLRTRYPQAYAEYLRTGIYPPDETCLFPGVAGFLEENATRPVVLDGFPRRESQAAWLLQHLAAQKRPFIMLYYTLPEPVWPVVWARAQQRNRPDDTLEKFVTRFKAAQHYDPELMAFFKNRPDSAEIYAEIDASGTPEEVWAATRTLLLRHNFL